MGKRLRIIFGATVICSLFSTGANAKFLSIDPVQFDGDNPNPAHFNRYAYANNDPINNWDAFGLCSSQAGKFVNCPTPTPVQGGVIMQGADFNGLQTNYVSADTMATLHDTVNTIDEATSTPSGQSNLVGGQQANSVTTLNVLVNSGQTDSTGTTRTFTDTLSGTSTAYIDTNETMAVSAQIGSLTTASVATPAEKIIHEVGHATNPRTPGATPAQINNDENNIQAISNSIHIERGSRTIIH